MSLLFPEGWVLLNWLNGVKLRKPSGCLKPRGGGGGDGRRAGAPEERHSGRSDAAERPGCGRARGSWQ